MEKVKCAWCNTENVKEEMSVIYGKNAFFNKSIFYGCKGEHINNVKSFLEKTEKFYSNTQSTFLISVILYPLLMFIFKKYFHWITIIFTIDFGAGLMFFPFGSSALTEKIGIQKSSILLRTIALALITCAVILIIRYWN